MSSEHDGDSIGYFDVRFARLPVPIAGVFDSPTVTLTFNVNWIGHLDGVIERLAWADSWEAYAPGDSEWVIQEVYKLLSSFNPTELSFFVVGSSMLGESKLG